MKKIGISRNVLLFSLGIVIALALILFGVFNAEGAGCARTGMRLVPINDQAGTIYFYGAPSTTSMFSSRHLYLEFDSSALGSVTICRYVLNDGVLAAIDDTLSLVMVPGQRRTLSTDGVVAFAYVKSVITDKLKYEATACENPDMSWMDEGSSLRDLGPPFNKGTSGMNFTTTSSTFSFLNENSHHGWWGYTYVVCSGFNAAQVRARWFLDGAIRRDMYLSAGGAVADYIACDSIIVAKAAADSVYFGGYYNR